MCVCVWQGQAQVTYGGVTYYDTMQQQAQPKPSPPRRTSQPVTIKPPPPELHFASEWPAPHPSLPPSLSLTLIRQLQVSTCLHLLQVGLNSSSYCSTWLPFRFFKNLSSFEKVWLVSADRKMQLLPCLVWRSGMAGSVRSCGPKYQPHPGRDGRTKVKTDSAGDSQHHWWNMTFSFFVSLFLPCSSRAAQTVVLLCSRRFDPINAEPWTRDRVPVGLSGWNPLEPLWSI